MSPVRKGQATAGARVMPSTPQSRQQTRQVVNVADEEARRFGGTSHLTRQMRTEITKSRLAPPPLLDADELADAVQQQRQDERARHANEDRRARREYEAFLAGRQGRELPSDEELDLDEPVDIDDDGRVVATSDNPVRDRLEREAAATRNGRATSAHRGDALEQLRREADDAARSIREAPITSRPTHERLVAPRPSMAVSREDTLLTDASAMPAASGMTARLCTLADVDRLWDWIRADAPSGVRFIGKPLSNSQQLHALMTAVAKGEGTQASLARSIYLGDTHAGFVVLLPILLIEKMAAVHVYLPPASRGLLPNMLPSLLQLAADVMPDIKLAVMGMTPSLDKLLHPYGFRMQTVFLQE